MNETTREDYAAATRLFNESVAALNEIREHLDTIDKYQTQQQQSTDTLNDSAEASRSVVDGLSHVGTIGEQLLESLTQAVTAATAVFDQETIQAVRDDIKDLRDDVAAQQTTQTDLQTVQDELDTLRSQIQTLPSRTRRKHGL